MTLLSLDHIIFGSGYGFKSPHWDERFYWLDGVLYTFSGGLGAQLHSVQWTHPKPGEMRRICGQDFRPFSSYRRWGRVMVSWAWARQPKDLNEAVIAIRSMEGALGRVGHFQWPPAQAIEARRAATTGAVHESAVGKADAPETHPEPPLQG